MDASLFPMLVIALILWVGVFAYMLFVERRVAGLEKRVAEAQQRRAADAERLAAR